MDIKKNSLAYKFYTLDSWRYLYFFPILSGALYAYLFENQDFSNTYKSLNINIGCLDSVTSLWHFWYTVIVNIIFCPFIFIVFNIIGICIVVCTVLLFSAILLIINTYSLLKTPINFIFNLTLGMCNKIYNECNWITNSIRNFIKKLRTPVDFK